MHGPDWEPSAEEMNTLILRLMWGVNAVSFRCFGDRIIAGPFAGMAIPKRPPWDDGNSSCKLLGSYEHELHQTVEDIEWREPKVIIDVGCAEGYYAIGFAQKLRIPVYAFDTDERSLEFCKDYAQRNGVEELITTITGTKNAADLRLPDAPAGHRFYLFDCEGDELDLVDLDACPELINSDIVVECHDFLKPHTSRVVADRLTNTHRVTQIRQALPDWSRFRYLKPSVISLLTVAEKRPIPCSWLVCWANRRGD